MSRSLVCRASVLALVVGLAFAGTALAQGAWVAPQSEKPKKNPLPNDKKIIEQGEKVAKINCAPCHGEKGKGGRRRRRRAQSQARRLDLGPRAERDRRRAVLEDFQRAGTDAAVEASPG